MKKLWGPIVLVCHLVFFSSVFKTSLWHYGGGGRAIAALNFSLSEYFRFLLENFSPKVQNLGLKIPHFGGGNLGTKLKLWAPVMSSVGMFAAFCWKVASFCPPTFFNPRRHWYKCWWSYYTTQLIYNWSRKHFCFGLRTFLFATVSAMHDFPDNLHFFYRLIF